MAAWENAVSKLSFLNVQGTAGRRVNGLLGLSSLDEKTILLLVILLDKTVSVG